MNLQYMLEHDMDIKRKEFRRVAENGLFRKKVYEPRVYKVSDDGDRLVQEPEDYTKPIHLVSIPDAEKEELRMFELIE